MRKHKRAAQREARGLPEFATRQQRQTPAAEGIKAAQQEQQAWDLGAALGALVVEYSESFDGGPYPYTAALIGLLDSTDPAYKHAARALGRVLTAFVNEAEEHS